MYDEHDFYYIQFVNEAIKIYSIVYFAVALRILFSTTPHRATLHIYSIAHTSHVRHVRNISTKKKIIITMIGAGNNQTKYFRSVSILLLVFVVFGSALKCSYRLSSVSLCGCLCSKLII